MKNLFLAIAMVFSLTVMGRTEKTGKTAETAPVFKNDKMISASEEPISMRNLPKAAREYLKENYPVRQIKGIFKIKDNGATVYEVRIKLEGKMTVVKFDSKGEYIDE